ncbi:hypothetical protein QR680_005693 [Steinernema hermaphroditum]|uniref:Uncharacterized protein n=1 Tax=Steinernema hermaphroditum TaxID=289476 RepID=A0AA39HU45_9BILA|nr:hypothetical protein QR680_005693 [Steinernema hermaphroditum]
MPKLGPNQTAKTIPNVRELFSRWIDEQRLVPPPLRHLLLPFPIEWSSIKSSAPHRNNTTKLPRESGEEATHPFCGETTSIGWMSMAMSSWATSATSMGSSSGIAGFGKRFFLRRPDIRAHPRATNDLESDRLPTPEAIHERLVAFVFERQRIGPEGWNYGSIWTDRMSRGKKGDLQRDVNRTDDDRLEYKPEMKCNWRRKAR